MTSRRATVLTFAAAVVFALVLRGGAAIGIALLFVVFVPLEKLFAFRQQQRVPRRLLTDLTHILVNSARDRGRRWSRWSSSPPSRASGSDASTWWARCPRRSRSRLAVALVAVGELLGSPAHAPVPFLWRFHSVHHSIEQMDWVASGRLHPFDQAFTQAFTVFPLFLLGYGAGVFGGVAVFITLLALFQHANVRLRFPGLRWVDQHARVAPLAPRDRRRRARQELRPARRRQDLRHRVPAEGPATGRLRHARHRSPPTGTSGTSPTRSRARRRHPSANVS